MASGAIMSEYCSGEQNDQRRTQTMAPKAYEAMRDKFKKEGMKDKEAKEKAARIYNAKHPDKPVTRKPHGTR